MLVRQSETATSSLLLRSSLVMACNPMGWYLDESRNFVFRRTAQSMRYWSRMAVMPPTWCQFTMTGVEGQREW